MSGIIPDNLSKMIEGFAPAFHKAGALCGRSTLPLQLFVEMPGDFQKHIGMIKKSESLQQQQVFVRGSCGIGALELLMGSLVKAAQAVGKAEIFNRKGQEFKCFGIDESDFFIRAEQNVLHIHIAMAQAEPHIAEDA